jgi:GMP synthase (glutamine-hydrolysing)
MILILSTCKEKFSEEEFVRPIADIIKDSYEIRHYKEKIDYRKYKKIIICGTALKDNDYLENMVCFDFLRKTTLPVLGICSGMQVIGLIFGAKIKKKTEIGMISVKTVKENILFSGSFESYALHSNSLSDLNDFEVLAKSKDCVQAIKHKEKQLYGIMFHPEVRNKDIIEKFILL